MASYKDIAFAHLIIFTKEEIVMKHKKIIFCVFVLIITACCFTNTFSSHTIHLREHRPVHIYSEHLTLSCGLSKQLSPSHFLQGTINRSLLWTSNNDSVAAINNRGILKTRGVGSALITAKPAGFANRRFYFHVKVTANEGLLSNRVLNHQHLSDNDSLMIVAHPDDEMLWGGGNMIRDIQNGARYFVVCLTNGSHPRRAHDFNSAMNAIGAKHMILTYPDVFRGHRVNWNPYINSISKDILTLLNYRKWNKIITHNPDGEYHHHHHLKTNELVTGHCRNRPSSYNNLYYFEKIYAPAAIPDFLHKLPVDIARKKHDIIFTYYADRRSIYKFEYFNDYENWIKATDWK